MSTRNTTSFKVMACAAIALALTTASGWIFVASTAVVRQIVAPVQMLANTAHAPPLVRAAATGLLQ
jgi:Na+(H+)/acetate symporter ActP